MRLTVCIFVLMASCSVLAKKSNYWWMFPKFDEHSPDHQLESAGVPDDLDESFLLPSNNNASQPYLKPIDGSYDEKEQNDEEIREEEENEDAEQEEGELQGEEGALALNEELDDADLDLDQDQDKEELLILKENGIVDWDDLLDDNDENENKSGSEEKTEVKNTIDEAAEEDDSSSEEDEEESTAENDTKEAAKKLEAAVQKAIEEQEGSGKEPEGSGESEPEGSGENQDTTDDEEIKSGQVEPRSKPDTSNTNVDDDSDDNMFDDDDDDDEDENPSESSTEQDVKEPVHPTPRLDLGHNKDDMNIQPLAPEFQQTVTTTCDFKQPPLIPVADPKFITELPGTDSLLICRLMPGQYNATLPAFRVTWNFEKATCPKGTESSCRVVLNTTIYDSPTGPNNLTYVVAYTLLNLNHSDVGEYTCEVDFYGCPPQTSINATRITSQPINVRLYEKPDYAVHIGVISAACVILFVILAGLCYFVWKQEKAKEGNYKMLLATTNVEYAPTSKMLQPPNSVYNPTTTNAVGFTKMSSVSSFGSKSSFSSNEEFQEP